LLKLARATEEKTIWVNALFLNSNLGPTVLGSNMTKLIAIAAAGLFVAGTMFAGEHGNCPTKVGNEAKAACQASMATLNLNADQKTKMDAAMAEHHKAGCNEASEAKFMKDAETILTPEQFAKFKAECKHEKDKTKA